MGPQTRQYTPGQTHGVSISHAGSTAGMPQKASLTGYPHAIAPARGASALAFAVGLTALHGRT